MLNQILRENRFTVLATQPAATAEQISALTDYFGSVPPEYVDLICEATELELQHQKGQYVRIWGPLGCMEMDEGYSIRQRISDAVPIGDDGGGHVIFYADGKCGHGLYHVGYGNLDQDDAIWIVPSLYAFLTKAEGVETF